MTLILHRAERTDALAEGLARLLIDPLDDPFAQELVIVPTRGVERWLAQSLAGRLGAGPRGGDGICAGVRFVAPHSLVALLTGRERDDPWHPDRLVWPLLEQIDANLGEPWCRTLAEHLGHGADDPDGHKAGRRYAVARRVAGLFTSYAAQRPSLLTAWGAGELTDGTPRGSSSTSGSSGVLSSPELAEGVSKGRARDEPVSRPLDADLDPDLVWQAKLWRCLLEQIADPTPDQRHTRTLEQLRAGQDPAPNAALPPRISFFGHTRMPVTELELLEALAIHRDVHLWLPQPSDALWRAACDIPSGAVPRVEDRSAELVRHPLLASLGRDARELQRGLPAAEDRTEPVPEPAEPPTSVLGLLQHDIHRNTLPDNTIREQRRVTADDRSLQVHACHGAARQVEVLREVLTGLLQDDPTLEPRDILVMCPDIESYAPLVQAAFGLREQSGPGPAAGHPAHTLRVKLADRSLARVNPLFEIASDLVDFAVGRLRVSDLRALIARQPVRRRFGLDEEDLERIAEWIDEAQIRWGLDGDHRQRFELSDIDQNTWRFGLRRLLLGVTMSSAGGAALGEVLPVDDVESGDIDLIGRFAELIDRIGGSLDALLAARTADDWMAALTDGVSGLGAVSRETLWQQAQFDRELQVVRSMAAGGTALRVSDVRELLRSRLEGRATRANFRTGTITVCTMMPMRSVPHRVICLLGLDDGIFPRSNGIDGDDVLARLPLTGERDPRSEDRQLLLDAVLAATDHLIVTYTGAGEHTGAEHPPAAPLGELIDAARRCATWPEDRDVVVRHPLQPFDARNLVPGALDTAEPFSFDRTALVGARAAQHQRPADPRLLTTPLPRQPADDVNFADLARFFADPAAHFVRRRLDVALPYEEQEAGDAMPITLDGLQSWQIGDRALQESLVGTAPDAITRMERLRGAIPPGALGGEVLRKSIDGVKALRGPVVELLQRETASIDLDARLPDGRRVTGTIGDLRGDVHLAITYSTLRAKQRLQSWLTLLALAAAVPDRPWQAAAAGWLRGGTHRQAGYYLAGGLDQETATRYLAELVDVYDRGMCGPIPLALNTSLAYTEKLAQRSGNDRFAIEAAKQKWESAGFGERRIPGDGDQPAPQLLYGGTLPFDDLLAERPLDDEAWNAATSRLGQYALRVWSPLLANQGAHT
ncbi:MAG TPA: exodeoxyribonuclease V subunit gamma [Flexivirga sp.]|uniref:exodeoxyribonuclease V subunit gamma n=1 Tax=Flexivirga sp. TaxID=1962927 RepID=UPI002B67738F|nr:exodeoxyribonuclease V subunit gamma [Flexivirga sp.]HWC22889.1 exodeoxyribonuclease V subunit gamma [Flexivirga sp.]